MIEELLGVLRDCLKGKRSHAWWCEWWKVNSARVETECGRFLYLRLEKRGLGCAHEVLEEHGIPTEWNQRYCPRCGEPTLVAWPEVTTRKELAAFDEERRKRGLPGIVEDGWIHPGVYCVNHDTLVITEVAVDKDGRPLGPRVPEVRDERGDG